jgi:AcrR family transcriptional regulator
MSTVRAPAGERRDRPLRADAQRNYQRLLVTASEVFIERGADDVSLEEIARRTGVGIGTLYRHFPSRQALLEAVYLGQVDMLCERADQLNRSDDPAAALQTWLRMLVEFGRTKRSLTAAMLETLGKDSELLSACSMKLREAATAVLTRAQQAGAARADASATDLLRLAHAISIAVDREPADRGQADRLLGLILDGLRPQPA